jgi:phage terminase large subunit-like protein
VNSGESWRDLPPSARARLRDRLLDEVVRARRALWTPYPWQKPPAEIPAQGMWLQLGGRGTGKTDGCARYVVDHVHGPVCDPRLPGGHRIAIVAPTQGDAIESCVNGPSGLRAHDPSIKLRGGVDGAHVKWPTGAEARLFGAHTPDDVERLRSGGNRCLVWLEEVAAMRYLGAAYDHAAFGLRIGRRPHFVGSTTPKPRKELRELLADPLTMTTRGRTAEAVHLDEAVRARLLAKYGGKRLGKQELEGELLEDVEGALWAFDAIAAARVTPSEVPDMLRKCVAMDPAVSVTETSDETGLVAVGLGIDRHCYVLADRSARVAGNEAARRCWQLWADTDADVVVYEDNQGKRWVADVLKQVWRQMQDEGLLPGGNAPLVAVTAQVGKRLRAEPVAAMYEDPTMVHHVGVFDELEDQQTTWIPESGTSPDRLDALVHGITHLASRLDKVAIATPAGLSRSAFGGSPVPGGALPGSAARAAAAAVRRR